MRYPRASNAVRALLIPAGALALALATGCPDKKTKYPTCEGDRDCKDGERCVDKQCVQCAEASDCGPGQTCEAGACVAEGACSSDADCPLFQVCLDGACSACSSNAECAGGECREGNCVKLGQCLVDEDCADDEDCVEGLCKFMGLRAPSAETSCDMATVYFDFDASGVRDDQRAQLEANAACLQQESERSVYVVGLTDPRGTEEYNVALSDGRARAVADYLARLGIDPARLRIMPKGEAEAKGTDDATWPQDRKVEFEWQ